MSSNPWITGVVTIKRHTRAVQCMAVWSQVKIRGRGPVCNTKAPLQLQLCRYISGICLGLSGCTEQKLLKIIFNFKTIYTSPTTRYGPAGHQKQTEIHLYHIPDHLKKQHIFANISRYMVSYPRLTKISIIIRNRGIAGSQVVSCARASGVSCS